MTPRINIPKISSFGFSQITTPGPLSPVSKRKLRNTLPPSPTVTTPQCPSPPRETFPFLWQCCSCYTIYRFSTTRRCLNCSHHYCTREVAFGDSNEFSSSGGSSSNKKRRRKNKYCRSEFDYEGWAAWGAWRRGHALGIESTRPEDADAEKRTREAKFVTKTHNCFTDCDFPSQCFHTQIRVLEDRMREAGREDDETEELTEEDDEILRAYATSSSIIHAEADYAEEEEEDDDDYLELNLARDLPADEEEGETSPTSPSSRSPFFYDDNNHKSSSQVSRNTEPVYPFIIPGLGSSPSSPAVDATKLTTDEIFALIDEDDDMMPLEDSKTGTFRRRAGADSRLSVRPNNPSETVSWADLPDDLSDLSDDLSDRGSSVNNGAGAGDDDKYRRPNSSGSDASSSSAEWEDVDDEEEDVDMTEDRETQGNGTALRLFKKARFAFMIEAEP
ncbi:Ammonium transporter [Apiospora arundinis]